MKGPGDNSIQDKATMLKITILLSSCFILPVVFPSPFSLITGFLAVPVFYILRTIPEPEGKQIIRNGILLVGVAGLLSLKALPDVIFSLTFIPLGYSLHVSAQKNEAPWIGVIKGALVLGTSWLIFWLGYAAGFDVNPYTELKQILDNWLSELYEIYKNNDIPADVLLNRQKEFVLLKELIPRILPGVLLSSVVMTAWINQVTGNGILRKIKPERTPWPEYRQWVVPDKFVWVLITSGILLLIGIGFLKDLGLCMIFISWVIYFFQGLAVLLHYFNKWNTPKAIRIIIVLFTCIQTTAFFVLAMFGLADIWRDFRQLRQNDTQSVK
ncbi:MAG: YybS family protein [Desulfobulbaceae bacterium]|nr:YybS family protein [Desulfobulbaceae bacterium]